MLLFRSEDEIAAWTKRAGEPKGEFLTLDQVWALSKVWYGDRLSPEYRGRTNAQVKAIFDACGLTSDHWQLKEERSRASDTG